MSGEAAALNVHILLPELVKSVLEGVGRRCFRWHAEEVDSSPSPLFGWRTFDECDL